MKKSPRDLFKGSIYPSYKHCDCGGEYLRDSHPSYGLLAPFCQDCGEEAPVKWLNIKFHQARFRIRYTKTGEQLRSMDQAILTSVQVMKELEAGVFDEDKYKRKDRVGSLGESVGSFISRAVLPLYPEKDESPEYRYYKEKLAAHLADVGVFALCEVHYWLYVRDMQIQKQPERDYVKRLFDQVVELTRTQLSA